VYFLLRMKLTYGRRAKFVVSHTRGSADGERREVILEEHELLEPERLPNRERGWIIPVNPQPGDEIRFEMAELEPIGPRGAAYEWEVSFSGAHGPSNMENPSLFNVIVPRQTEDDIEACPDALVLADRVVKDGPRSFSWAS
jgi:hypothetical protein